MALTFQNGFTARFLDIGSDCDAHNERNFRIAPVGGSDSAFYPIFCRGRYESKKLKENAALTS